MNETLSYARRSGQWQVNESFSDFTMDLERQKWLAENADAVLDAVVDAIITIDTQGSIQSVNSATLQIFGYTESELIGAPLICLMPEPHHSGHQRYIDDFIRTHNPKIIGVGRELLAVKKSGQTFPIYLAVSEIRSDEGLFFVGIIRDLSAEKAAADALLEQKEKVAQVGRLTTMGEMTASIAHEINQPLTAISMYAQAVIRLMGRDDVDADKILDALGKLNEQSLRAGAVIERIQRFVQHADGDREFVDINGLLSEIKSLAAGDARLHGIELELNLDRSLPNIFCDPIQVQQVTLNLVRNAIDAMFEIECAHGCSVRVISEAQDGAASISVQDCGPGVKDEVANELFTPFHSTKRNGMGMGLSICRSIVEDHGGVLRFENNRNFGATFSFTLPAGETPDG
ncbi:MAG: PAS domain S-box protein [Pseudomonadales bacterium]|nr:PAS domain S-box protein [Pseudomonadales bacterium]